MSRNSETDGDPEESIIAAINLLDRPRAFSLTRRVGPYDVVLDDESLVLRLPDRGELTLAILIVLGLIMAGVLALGIIGMTHMAETSTSVPHASIDNPGRLLAPRQNHYGFLWGLSCLLLLVIGPLAIRRAYNVPVAFTFQKGDGQFLRDGRIVCPLRRIESLAITETRDPEGKYLYLLDLIYGDGQSLLLHNGYDEREIMNLANEISAFVNRKVVWQ